MTSPTVQAVESTGESAPLLAVRNLRVSFRAAHGLVRAVNDVSFDIRPRERLGIAGESGSGKSVLAQSLLGLVRDADVEGSARFGDIDLIAADDAQRRQIRGKEIGYVFQDPLSALDPVRTVGYQLVEPLRIRGVGKAEARRRAIDLLGQVGIKDAARRMDDYPHQFSGGMRQRVVIAMALVAEPQLIIADEPTTALDVRVQAQVLDLLNQLADDRDLAVVLITHDLGILAGFAERVMVMYAGRVMEAADTDSLFYGSINPYTLGLLASLPRVEGKNPERLTTIGGRPPSPSALPEGCPFNTRCRYVIDVCLEQMPALETPPNGDHPSACHRSEWLAETPGVLR
jgi:oligopeptide/dipeptide ABC transporter ATP-binding protein